MSDNLYKAFIVVAVLILLCCSSVPCYATEIETTEETTATTETAETTEATEPEETEPETSEAPTEGTEAVTDPTEPLKVDITDESIEKIASAVSTEAVTVTVTNKQGTTYTVPEIVASYMGEFDHYFFTSGALSSLHYLVRGIDSVEQDPSNSNKFIFSGENLYVAQFNPKLIPNSIQTEYYGSLSLTLSNLSYSTLTFYNSDGSVYYESDSDPVVPEYTVLLDYMCNDFTNEEFSSTGFVAPEPTRVGFSFVGWYFDENYTLPYSSGYQFTQDTTLYAKWVQDEFWVSFYTGFSDLVLPPASSIGFVAPEITQEGYQFDGWYFDEGFTLPYSPGYLFTQDTALYAKWTKLVKISFDSGIPGIEFASVSVPSGTTYSVPVLTASGYDYHGAFIDSNFEDQFVDGTVVDSDITLFLRFTEKVYDTGELLAESVELSKGLQIIQSQLWIVLVVGLIYYVYRFLRLFF